MTNNALFEFALRMGDNCLILGQQISAWCGHAPILEEDIALANTSLDLIGQTQMWLGLAGEVEGAGRSADDLAFLRDSRAFKNALLTEQPNGDFGQTLMRQFLFDAWHYPMLSALTSSSNERVAEIAAKSVKEVTYHLDRSGDLVMRLGDGSTESHERMQNALNTLWRYSGELMTPDNIDDEVSAAGIAPPLSEIKVKFDTHVDDVFRRGQLTKPDGAFQHLGGKSGVHGEDHGFLLSEMQFLQRAYPGAQW